MKQASRKCRMGIGYLAYTLISRRNNMFDSIFACISLHFRILTCREDTTTMQFKVVLAKRRVHITFTEHDL